MDRILAHAFAKVNLLLTITEKTETNYHKMESIFAFLEDIYDELIFFPEEEFCEQSAIIPGVDSNLIHKAAQILQNNFDLKIPHVVIKKNLPIAGGVGGGSSDCACFINAVFDIWRIKSCEKMKYIGLFKSLGADAMIFLYKYFNNSRFVYLYGTGVDGIVQDFNLDIRGHYALIVNNNQHLSTKLVFENFSNQFGKAVGTQNIDFNFLKSFQNSLQMPAIKLLPELSGILNDLGKTTPVFYGVSGSGPTCFAVYESEECAKEAMQNLDYAYKRISRF